jgi:putative peptide zinc metalloprotease protein
MNHPDHCTYPPRLAPDVEITARGERGGPAFIAGSASVGRYLMLGATERQVLLLLDGTRTLLSVCQALTAGSGDNIQVPELARFLTKLDEVGILSGERAGRSEQELLPGSQFYKRWNLFNPDALFDRALPALRWIWTPWFFFMSVLLLAGTAALVLANWAEVSRYSGATLREHYLAIFFAAWLVAISHEFAHGMTSKAFGGRATEVGALLIYYCMPALYCNVSGLHLIPQRGRRMWVIAAGIYWQLLVGSSSLLVWFLFRPDTLAAQMAMVLVLGSLLDIMFNANPLIKLDGYYFLSQWLRMPNLMDRSRACWRALLRRLLPGGRNPNVSNPDIPSLDVPRFTRREQGILLVFGFCSFLYNLALPVVIVWYAAQFFMDRFQFPGLLLGCLLALAYVWNPVGKLVRRAEGGDMTANGSRSIRRYFMPAAMAACFVGGLCLPWTASVGSYGALVTIPGREAIIRAAEGASLVALNAQPGQTLAQGATIGLLGNLDLEEQIAQARTELARVKADADRLNGELLVQQESTATSEWQLAQRRSEYNDVEVEEQQISTTRLVGSGSSFLLASEAAPAAKPLPAALAAMEAEAAQLETRLAAADQKLNRARSLFNAKVLARVDLDEAEANRAALAFALSASRERLNTALIEHRRRHTSTQTEVNVAGTKLSAARAQETSLHLQLEAVHRLEESLDARLVLLQRKRAQFELAAPVQGILFGEDLPRMVGQYFPKGTEICRIADTGVMLVRVQVAEEALGDIALAQKVRVKTRAFPDRVFHGEVSKIGGESELDSNGQRSYRVELTIKNPDGLLRPGMTVFARIDFGRHMLAWVAVHKLGQSLRPELWML